MRTYYIYSNGVPVRHISFEGEPVWPGIPIPAGDGEHTAPIAGAGFPLGALLDGTLLEGERQRPEVRPGRP